MKTSVKILVVPFIVLIFFALNFISCKKEDPYYGLKAKILYKSSEQPVSGATVRVNKKDIDTTLTTDSRGEITLEYKYPMILDITATFQTTLNGSPYVMQGKAVVKLEENKVVEKIVYIQ